MPLLAKGRSLLRNLLSRRRVDADLDREVRAHLDLLIDENLRAGMGRAEAERAARLELGGVEQVKEQVRDHRLGNWVQSVLSDARYALRQLRKNPGFTAVATTALALGIGFSAIVFSIFYNGILHPFPYRDADRLKVISIASETDPRYRRPFFQLDELAALRKANHTFEDIAGTTSWDALYNKQGVNEEIHGVVVTPNFMDFWGVRPLLGRGLTAQDAEVGAPPVVLLGYLYWKKEFNGDKSVLGKTMTVDRQPRTIIGVMPPRFFLFGADFYTTIPWNRPEPSLDDAFANNLPFYFFANGLIKKGVSAQTASADLRQLAEPLALTHKENYPERFNILTLSFSEEIVGDFSKTMYLLIGSVALLLLISGSNVAGLLLVHTSARGKEICLCAALGASRSRLVRQLFIESLMLGAIGCIAGTLLAFVGLNSLRVVPGIEVPGEADLSLNWPVVLFAVAISLGTTVLFGLSPALFAVGKDLRTSLQGAGVNTGSSNLGSKVRAGLVVAQVAISLVLLVFAGLMVQSFVAITHFDPGISTKNLFIAEIHFPGHQYDTTATKQAVLEETLGRISAVAGVLHATTAVGYPEHNQVGSDDITIPGKAHDKKWAVMLDAVGDTYFATLGVPLLRGRLLSPSDIASGRRVAVVNNTFAHQFFPDDDPIGHQVKLNVFDQIPMTPHDAYFEIVGVAGDFRNVGIQNPVLPEVFLPYTYSAFDDRTILVRTAGNPLLLTHTVRQILNDVDPNPVLSRPDSFENILHDHDFMKPRFRVFSFSACAGIGLGLSLIGLFGVMAYSVTLQTQEFGIRMALGALTGDILGLVLRKGSILVTSGIVLGLVASCFAVRVVKSQLWGVSEFDARVLLMAPLALLAAGLFACYLPARRATRVDPMVALRYE